MAKGHIDDATLLEMLQILKTAIEGDTVFDAEHDALEASVLVHPKIIGRAGQSEILAVLADNLLNLVEDIVSKGRWVLCWLWQVGHHDGSILTAFGHLMEVDKDLRVTMVEADALRKEHRRVTMGIEGKHPVVGAMGLTVEGGFANEPLEERQSLFQTLRMPLDTNNRFELGALHSLDNTIGRHGHRTKFIARRGNGLMMEGVDV